MCRLASCRDLLNIDGNHVNRGCLSPGVVGALSSEMAWLVIIETSYWRCRARVAVFEGCRGRVWLLVVMPSWRISLNWVAVVFHMVVTPVVVSVLLPATTVVVAAVAEIPLSCGFSHTI